MVDRAHRGMRACATTAIGVISLLLANAGLPRSSGAACPNLASYDEGIDGEIPGHPIPPLALDAGIDDLRIRGSIGGGDQVDDISFTIEPGEQLMAVTPTGFAGTPSNALRFFTGTDTAADPPAFLGEDQMGPGLVGADFLALLGIGPLGPGVYSISVVGGDPL